MLLNPYRFGVPATDPFFANVVLGLHFDGTNGSQVFTDIKGHTISVTGTAPQLTTTGPKFGTACYTSTGANGTTSSVASTDWDMGTGDFCAEGFFFQTSASLRIFITNCNALGSRRGPTVFQNGTGGIRAFCGDSAGTLFGDISGGAVSASTWYHYAYTRSGNNFRLFLDGNQVGSTVVAATSCGSGVPLHIGYDPGTAGREFIGNLDDFRLTKGVARYTANFTPPSAAFPNS